MCASVKICNFELPPSIAEMMMITGYTRTAYMHRLTNYLRKKKKNKSAIRNTDKEQKVLKTVELGSGLKELSITVGMNFILGG